MNATAAASTTSDVMDFVEITHEPLDVQRATALVTHASAGAIATFIGTTRDNFDGKRVVRLEYEGYEPMARAELHKICVQVRARWPGVVGIALFHRLGVVEVAHASVAVAVSSPHRADALEACAFAIDTLKATVPIWKSEQYEGDTRVWKENAEWRSGATAMAATGHPDGGCCTPKRVMVSLSGETSDV